MRTNLLISKILPYIMNIEDECILYPYVNKEGYGHIQYRDDKGKKKHYLAHRLAYEVHNNVDLSSEQLILHSCDIPNCVNPNHLRIGTHLDNSNDKIIRNRQAKGDSNGRYITGYNSKYQPIEKPKLPFNKLFNRSLSREEIIVIKEAIRNKGSKTLKKLSEELGIKYQTIRDLNINRSYKDI